MFWNAASTHIDTYSHFGAPRWLGYHFSGNLPKRDCNIPARVQVVIEAMDGPTLYLLPVFVMEGGPNLYSWDDSSMQMRLWCAVFQLLTSEPKQTVMRSIANMSVLREVLNVLPHHVVHQRIWCSFTRLHAYAAILEFTAERVNHVIFISFHFLHKLNSLHCASAQDQRYRTIVLTIFHFQVYTRIHLIT